MQLSTTKILDVLRQLPATGKLKPVDFAERATETDQRTDTVIAEEGNREDVLQLKIKAPRMTPHYRNTLTLKEQLELKDELTIAKRALENFKDLLRQKGFSVEHYFVSIQNGRISYHIPNQEHYHLFMRNKDKFLKHADTLEAEPARFLRRSR